MKISGAIFDMDGTLVDSLFYWKYFWNEVGRRFLGEENFTPEEAVDKKIRTQIFTDAIEEIVKKYDFSGKEEQFREFALGSITEFYRTQSKIKKGAVELLDYLKKGGAKICLASATGKENVLFALRHHDLEKYFDLVLSCAEIGVGKDKPDIYLLAAKTLGCETTDSCVVEDSFVAIETAKKAGFKTVGVYDKYNYEHDRLKASSDIYIDENGSLTDLIPQIKVK